MMLRTKPSCWAIWLLLYHSMASASSGYSPDELNALAGREQRSLSAPPASTQTTLPDERPFIEAARDQGRLWHKRLTPSALQGIASTQQFNPNTTPSGVMVFVSLTMPDSSLRALLKQSEAWQVPLVIQGVLPEGFMATTDKIQRLLKTDKKDTIHSGFTISPEWFQTFNIREVPTFVAVKPGRCLPKQPCGERDYDIVKGNVSIADALAHLAQGDNPDVVRRLLERKHHENDE
ncbi:type-F conjugative transfer system pilin assembly protein TrbC [Vibrio brasiliensis]|uniref:type-F conjugative transfer system pilin assembly protein TrbC n=1 Tax=Vibrio brasiliensis TaxID=170652 RepID=UPI001EFDA6EF|nr:type-F conjugative transfer system pilin assembly protein TrbC [Vibrio brasiliensis]MCG9727489.1 type-F conjugative transfer system pilin assembly protein TrbC [Vibrio brasiliensis]